MRRLVAWVGLWATEVARTHTQRTEDARLGIYRDPDGTPHYRRSY